jgi:uncharacterized protein (TIGR00369 family)
VKLDPDLTGLENLQAMIDDRGGQAPLHKALAIRLVEVGDGWAVFQGQPDESHYNPQGTVHGGWISAILDSALGCAVHTRLGAGKGYTTLELKVNMVRAVSAATGIVSARGEIVHLGRRTATSEAKLVDTDGKLLAHASSTCLIL